MADVKSDWIDELTDNDKREMLAEHSELVAAAQCLVRAHVRGDLVEPQPNFLHVSETAYRNAWKRLMEVVCRG